MIFFFALKEGKYIQGPSQLLQHDSNMSLNLLSNGSRAKIYERFNAYSVSITFNEKKRTKNSFTKDCG